jgi:hypothetical protein
MPTIRSNGTNYTLNSGLLTGRSILFVPRHHLYIQATVYDPAPMILPLFIAFLLLGTSSFGFIPGQTRKPGFQMVLSVLSERQMQFWEDVEQGEIVLNVKGTGQFTLERSLISSVALLVWRCFVLLWAHISSIIKNCRSR